MVMEEASMEEGRGGSSMEEVSQDMPTAKIYIFGVLV